MYSWLESNQASRMGGRKEGGGILVAGHESVEWCYCDLVCQWWCTHCIKIKAANQGCSKSERRSATGANKTWCHQLRIRMKYLEVYSSNSSNTDARELILSNDTSVVSLSGIKTMLIVTMWCFFAKENHWGPVICAAVQTFPYCLWNSFRNSRVSVGQSFIWCKSRSGDGVVPLVLLFWWWCLNVCAMFSMFHGVSRRVKELVYQW